MKWHHILDKQPEDGAIIVHCDPVGYLYDEANVRDYLMGIRRYKQSMPWSAFMEWCTKSGYRPDFYWMYEKDFPFPHKDLL